MKKVWWIVQQQWHIIWYRKLFMWGVCIIWYNRNDCPNNAILFHSFNFGYVCFEDEEKKSCERISMYDFYTCPLLQKHSNGYNLCFSICPALLLWLCYTFCINRYACRYIIKWWIQKFFGKWAINKLMFM